MSAKFYPNYPPHDDFFGFGNYGGTSTGAGFEDCNSEDCSETNVRADDKANIAGDPVEKKQNDEGGEQGSDSGTYKVTDNRPAIRTVYSWGPFGGWTCFSGYVVTGPSENRIASTKK